MGRGWWDGAAGRQASAEKLPVHLLFDGGKILLQSIIKSLPISPVMNFSMTIGAYGSNPTGIVRTAL